MSRALYDRGWVGRAGHVTIGIADSALVVWLALEVESTVDDLTSEIRAAWPEFGAVKVSEVQIAMDALFQHGVVEEIGDRVDDPGRT